MNGQKLALLFTKGNSMRPTHGKGQQNFDKIHSFLEANPNRTITEVAEGVGMTVGGVKAVLYMNSEFVKAGVGGRASPYTWSLDVSVGVQS